LTQVSYLTRCWHKGKSAGPAPERPPNCSVRKTSLTWSSATTDPSDSTIPLDESSDTFPWSTFLQHHNSHSTIESVSKLGLDLDLDGQAPSASRSSTSDLLPSASEHERYESYLVSCARSRKPIAPSTVQAGWGPTLFDPVDQQQDDNCGSVTMTAIPIRTGHADWHQLPENSPTVYRRSHPIQFRTAAAPAISTISAVSSFNKLSWDPNNTPFRSPRSYVFMKSPAQSVQRSSMAHLSMSFEGLGL
jgi:hypothetical protein